VGMKIRKKRTDIPWNKGTKGVMKKNSGSFVKGERVSKKTEFKKGIIPWNKGLKGIHLSPYSEFKKGNPSWNKGRKYFMPNAILTEGYINYQGYIVLCIGGDEILEHRIIMERKIGRELMDNEVVHHKNKNRLDNRINNLKVMTKSEHSKHHYPDKKHIFSRWNKKI
jgi:hypothetical protein